MHSRQSVISKNITQKIQLAGKMLQLAEVLNLYRNALTGLSDEPFLYNFTITAVLNCGKPDIAWDVYNHAISNSADDEVTHASIMKAFSKLKDPELLNQAYTQAMKRNCNSIQFFNAALTAARDCENYDMARTIYTRVGSSADAITYSVMIQAAGINKDLPTAIHAYKEARKLNPKSDYIYNNFIKAAGQCSDIDLASEAFHLAVSNKAASIYTYANIISEASFNNRLNLAWDAYFLATQNLKLVDEQLHGKMLRVAATNGREDLFEKTLQRASEVSSEEILKKVHLIYETQKKQLKIAIHKLSSQKQHPALSTSSTTIEDNFEASVQLPQDLQEQFLSANKQNLTIRTAKTSDAETIGRKIKQSGQIKNFPMAIRLFDEALFTHNGTYFVYNAMITAAGECNQFEFAKHSFSEALRTQSYDAATYSCMINVAGKLNQLDFAKEVYHLALQGDLPFTKYLFTSMITAAGNNKDFDFAYQTYQKALDMHLNHERSNAEIVRIAGIAADWSYAEEAYQQILQASDSTVFVYNNVLIALGRCSKINEAEQLYLQLLSSNKADKITHTSMIQVGGLNNRLDLAELAYTTAVQLNQITHDMTHRLMIVAAEKYGRQDLIEQAYQNARQGATVVDAATVLAYTKASHSKIAPGALSPVLKTSFPSQFEYKEQKFPEATSKPIQPTPLVAPKTEMNEKQVYLQTVNYGFANQQAHKKMIVLAGEQNDIDFALIAYINGILAEPDLELHLLMMTAAGKNQHWVQVESARRNAIQLIGGDENNEIIAKAYNEATASKQRPAPQDKLLGKEPVKSRLTPHSAEFFSQSQASSSVQQGFIPNGPRPLKK